MTRIENADVLLGYCETERCYTDSTMSADIEAYFLSPPAGSAAARAAEFGIDLTLTLANLRLTPEERIRKLDSFIEGVANLKTSVLLKGPANDASKQDH